MVFLIILLIPWCLFGDFFFAFLKSEKYDSNIVKHFLFFYFDINLQGNIKYILNI